MPSKAAFYTLGCKLNFSETSTIGSQFKEKGFEIVDFTEPADVYVVNTCTVTENAEKECRQIVRRALRNNPNAFIAVTGCYAQLRPEEIAKMHGVDAVLGSSEKFKLFSLIDKFEKRELSCIHVSPTDELNETFSASSTDADSRTRAFLKVQDGCDYKCTFCTIPLARGKSRSLSPEVVVDNFKKLLDEGYKEIILTGVNVGDYGKNIEMDFYNLLQQILKVPGDYRLRISSIEPNLLTDDILELALSDERICRHFHIPLQSGSPKILKLMRRRYKQEFYGELIHKAASKFKNLGIGVDVIVGFPGETNDDFLDTYNFLKDLPVSYLHVFTYSERPDTLAIEMPEQVDYIERKRRNSMLRILSDKKRNEFYRSLIGTEADVLFEHNNKDGMMRGFASNYARVAADFDMERTNIFSKILIEKVEDNLCFGRVIK